MSEVTTGMKPEEPLIGKVSGCKKLNIRKEPNRESDVLDVVLEGSEVMIDESKSTDDFYKVYTESGLEGFCMKQYITVQP